MTHLPPGWAAASLGDLAAECGQRVPADDEEFFYVDISSVDRVSKTVREPQKLLGRVAPSRARKEIRAGDVLVSMTRPNLNAVAMIPHDLDGQIASTGFDVLRAIQVDPRWLFYTVRSPSFVDAMSDLVQGALYPAVKSGDVRSFPLPVAPLAEQRRIAGKLDDLLARVDACRDRLDRVPAILKRFKQAVLAAATSGELTREWREERERAFPWPERTLLQLGELGRGKSKHRPRNDERLFGGAYPFIQTGEVAQSGGRICQHSQTYSDFGLSQSKLWPANTLCITIAANIADTALLDYPACFPDSVVGFVADGTFCIPEFVKWSIDVIREDLEAFAPATAQKNINLAVLNEVRISTPELDEQREIVRRVNQLLALAEAVEVRHSAAVASVETMVPAILAKAFRGELVPQDPDDEPASVLLDRIRAERGETAAPSGRGRRAKVPVGAKP